MDDPAQDVVPSNPRAIGRTGRRVEPLDRRLELKTSVRPSAVVVERVDAKDPLQVAAAEDEHPVQALGSDRTDPPIGNAFARGARIGVFTMLTPSERKISSKGLENLESRSRITNRMPRSRSLTARFRACWVTHAESGFEVTPRTWTRRDATWITNSTYSVRSQTVSTVKRSSARIPWAWDLRNSLQVGPSRRGAGPIPFARSRDRIFVAETLMPSLASSPRILIHPHRGFSRPIRRIKSRTSSLIGGLPPRGGRR